MLTEHTPLFRYTCRFIKYFFLFGMAWLQLV